MPFWARIVLQSIKVLDVICYRVGETTEWDYMVFSQSWPSTTCTDWKSERASNYCALPKDQSHWIVHGLW